MSILIGLSGKKKSGKNTIANIIAKLSTVPVKELSFAYPLKCEVAKACGVTTGYIEEHKDNFRLILQGWGTDYKRKLVRDDYWTIKVREEIDKALDNGIQIIIVTDVRFKNEYDFINKINGVLVRVSRNTINDDTHPSETELDNVNRWHHVILNTGSLEDLVLGVKELLNKCKIKIK